MPLQATRLVLLSGRNVPGMVVALLLSVCLLPLQAQFASSAIRYDHVEFAGRFARGGNPGRAPSRWHVPVIALADGQTSNKVMLLFQQ